MKKLVIAMMALVLSLSFASISYAHGGDEYHPNIEQKNHHRHHRAVKNHVKKPIHHRAEPRVGHNK